MDRQDDSQRKTCPAAPASILAQGTTISSSHVRVPAPPRGQALSQASSPGAWGGWVEQAFSVSKASLGSKGWECPYLLPELVASSWGFPACPPLPHFPQFPFLACTLPAQNPRLGLGRVWNPLAPISASPKLPALWAPRAPPPVQPWAGLTCLLITPELDGDRLRGQSRGLPGHGEVARDASGAIVLPVGLVHQLALLRLRHLAGVHWAGGEG